MAVLKTIDYLDVAGSPDLQAALDAASDGDVVHAVGGHVYRAPPGGFRIRKMIELRGDGVGNPTDYSGTVLVPYDDGHDVLLIEPPSGVDLASLHLHDFRITSRPGVARDGNHGLRCVTSMTQKISQLVITRVGVSKLKGDAFSLLGTNGDAGAIVDLHMTKCIATDCDGYGATLRWVFASIMRHCRFRDNGKAGARVENSGLGVYQSTFDGNERLGGTEGNLHFTLCWTARVDACRFRRFTFGAKKGCVFDRSGGGGVIGACFFELAAIGTEVGIEVTSVDRSGPVMVLPNRFRLVKTPVAVGNLAVGCVVMPQHDDSPAGAGAAIQLPDDNRGLLAVSALNRTTGNTQVGLVVPSPDPAVGVTAGLQDGALKYEAGALSGHIAGSFEVIQLAPARITDLVVAAQGKHSLVVRWTGLGAAAYQLRRSTSPITEANFGGATLLPTSTPGPLGTWECFADSGLAQNGTYYYAIKAEASSVLSALSNVVSGTCQGAVEVDCP